MPVSNYNNTVSFKLDDYLLTELENYCHDTGRNTSQTIRDALFGHFFRHHKKTQGNTGNTDLESFKALLEDD
jgi:preprotein translocase subunit SecA